ncbi:OmpH family outer membrane protein [Sphingomicrobium flavum]|uniref:OmpH family outer membrane protein n=1 Tax=Sphingomicrobium flavum TaxID=1229164 RepID=UPI0021ADF481|nr:OmpH family outer membrane protein [Sphingomicrobium flavum]
MKKFLVPALIGAAFAMPAGAAAQQLPSTAIGVVDINQIQTTCTACVTARQQLQTQQQQLVQLRQSLQTPLTTEENAIQAEAQRLGDAARTNQALQQRVTTLQQNAANANRQLAQQEQIVQRNAAYVLQQINTQLSPAIDAVMARRGATVVMDASQLLKHNPAIDITADVLADLNARLTTIATVAPAPQQQPAQQQQPQGR